MTIKRPKKWSGKHVATKKRNKPGGWRGPSGSDRYTRAAAARARLAAWKKKKGISNPAKTRKGKTGRWMKAKAVKVVRKNGRLTVMVKR